MCSTDANATASYLLELENDLTSMPTANMSALNRNYTYMFGLANDIFFYGLCIVLPLGLMGNLFIVYVFLRSSSLRKTSTGQLLVALAIADITVLIGETFRWLSTLRIHINEKESYYFLSSLGLNFFDTTSAGCKITNFLRYSGSLWSAWITVAIAVERLIAVAWPLKIVSISTPRRVQILIALVGFGGLALSLFPFWTLDRLDTINGLRCRIINGSGYEVWNAIVIKSFTLTIPCVLITVLTVVIISLLYRARDQRKHFLSATMRSHYQTTALRMISVETQMTIMLVAVCVSAIVLKSPYTIAYSIRTSAWKPKPDNIGLTGVITYFAYRLTDLTNIINNAVNFLLYCLWGSSFRKECAKLLCCRRKDGEMSRSPSEKVSDH